MRFSDVRLMSVDMTDFKCVGHGRIDFPYYEPDKNIVGFFGDSGVGKTAISDLFVILRASVVINTTMVDIKYEDYLARGRSEAKVFYTFIMDTTSDESMIAVLEIRFNSKGITKRGIKVSPLYAEISSVNAFEDIVEDSPDPKTKRLVFNRLKQYINADVVIVGRLVKGANRKMVNPLQVDVLASALNSNFMNHRESSGAVIRKIIPYIVRVFHDPSTTVVFDDIDVGIGEETIKTLLSTIGANTNCGKLIFTATNTNLKMIPRVHAIDITTNPLNKFKVCSGICDGDECISKEFQYVLENILTV